MVLMNPSLEPAEPLIDKVWRPALFFRLAVWPNLSTWPLSFRP